MNINIETLLGRSITNIQNPLTIHEIKGKTILVTGAAGSIGSEIVKQVLKYEPSDAFVINVEGTTAILDGAVVQHGDALGSHACCRNSAGSKPPGSTATKVCVTNF